MTLSIPRLLFSLFIAATAITFVFAYNGYPLFSIDSSCFVPAGYFIRHTHALVNPFYDGGVSTTPGNFLFYPPLFPCVIALVSGMLPSHLNSLAATLTLLDTLTVAVLLLSLYRYIPKSRHRGTWITALFSAVWLTALFSFQGISPGRPEILCKLFISLFILNNLYPGSRKRNLFNGVLTGLTAITSPISTFYLLPMMWCVLLYREELTLRTVFETMAGAAFVFLLFAVFYPYKISELVTAMVAHSRNVIFHRYEESLLGGFKTNHLFTLNPLSVVSFFAALVIALSALLRKKKYRVIFPLTLLVAVVCYFSFRSMPMSYNLYVLTPPVFFIIFVWYVNTGEGVRLTGRHGIAQWLLIVLLAVNATGFIRRVAVFAAARDRFVTASYFRDEFESLQRKIRQGEKISITSGLWPYCLDRSDRVIIAYSGEQIPSDTAVRFLMVQQSYSGRLEPEVYPGFHIIKDGFIRQNVRLAGLKISNTYPGYQIAIYERN
ncbi:hypothetical protein [Hufsiella ginkgonis]|uniref:DUF2029 domain-containing protein n=1 Tax=Hufsiella ginkgonis TaxID=2695274 RepID=A0A7K1XZI4_9SPHI|nr:hypothetical protein [Hufsiella ginkgonis]MXV16421.1 hypothetical protein [Hufsiella ginkgonis]